MRRSLVTPLFCVLWLCYTFAIYIAGGRHVWPISVVSGYNYGVSYLGGKCTLASQIFAQFPGGYKTFVDPFAGGMSMSHYAALHGYSRVIANDLDGLAMSIFREYVSGASPMRGFVGRSQFNRYRRGTSGLCALMRMIYGFSGNCYSYMYCKAREMYSQAVNDALFFCDFQPLRMIFGERIASAMCDFFAGFDVDLPLRARQSHSFTDWQN